MARGIWARPAHPLIAKQRLGRRTPASAFVTFKEHITRQPNAGHLRAWHFDGRRPLLLLEVDVPHVHAEAPAEGILLVLHDLGIDRQGLKPRGGCPSTWIFGSHAQNYLERGPFQGSENGDLVPYCTPGEKEKKLVRVKQARTSRYVWRDRSPRMFFCFWEHCSITLMCYLAPRVDPWCSRNVDPTTSCSLARESKRHQTLGQR